MHNPVLDAALAYARRGWPVIPCRASDKAPLTPSGVHDSTTDPKIIRSWWQTWPRATVAIDVGGAGMLAIDFDVKHGKTMPELIASVEDAIGAKLPETKLRARSPSGGEHWFYALDNGEIVPPSTSRVAPHVDIRSHSSYVIAAPSPGYEWLSEGKPHFRSDPLFERALRSVRDKHTDRDNWLIEPDMAENVERCIDWLQHKAKIAVEGQGGDAMAYATAAYCKSLGVSQELALDLMWEHWNPRCNPPWSSDEFGHFEKKVENGYGYNTSPPGNCTAAYRKARLAQQFKPVRAVMGQGSEWKNGQFRIVDRAAVDEIAPPEWLLEGCLPARSYALLVAAAKSFKTFIALDMALTIATGGLMARAEERLWTPNKCGKVLYVLGEGRSGIKQRIRAWELKHNSGVAVENFFLGDPVPHPDEDQWKLFADNALKANNDEPYALVVLDTIGRSMQGRNVNAQEDASTFTMLVQAIQRDLGSAVLGLAHVGYGNHERATGSQVWDADPDTILVAERTDPKAFDVRLSMRKQKDAPEWEDAVGVKLCQCGDSLAVIKQSAPASKANQPKRKATEQNEANDAKALMVMECLDKALQEALGENKLRAYGDQEIAVILARALARDGAGETPGDQQIKKRYLSAMRLGKKYYAFKAYNPAARPSARWRWVD